MLDVDLGNAWFYLGINNVLVVITSPFQFIGCLHTDPEFSCGAEIAR